MRYKRAASQFQVPQNTLERYVKKKPTRNRNIEFPSCSSFQSSSPENITPIPRIDQRNKRISKNTRNGIILTLPVKEALLNSEKEKMNGSKRPGKRRLSLQENEKEQGPSKGRRCLNPPVAKCSNVSAGNKKDVS